MKQLIIAEKPQAAAKIAAALSSKASKKNLKGVPYYEFKLDNKDIIVASAVGHIFGLKQKEKNSNFPVFDIQWVPSYEDKKTDFTKKYFDVLKSLGKDADEFVIATDYDVEGELIGFNVLRFIFKTENAKRMKFSTLTKTDLEKAYKNMLATPEFGLAYAGETRHYLDWFYGINLSRALMSAIKNVGVFRIMSVGRVQGPALALVVDKEKDIRSFKSTPYWQVKINIKNSHEAELQLNRKIEKKDEIKNFELLKDKETEAKTEKEEKEIEPLHPFDLTTLQVEAYKFYGLTPSKTLEILQKLYLAGLISYPRTSSQKLPIAINYNLIIEKLSKLFPKIADKNLLIRKKPVEGSKDDPAHPSVYPTGEDPEKLKLLKEEKNVYELVLRRFLSCFADNALIEDKKIVVRESVNGKKEIFSAKGIKIKEKGWLEIYKAKLTEKELPDINGKVKIKKVDIEEKETQPPKRYTQASLIAELSKRNLGTKGTRANIIQTLFDRGYLKGKSVEATDLGIKVVESLQKHCPLILDENLTREFEEEMEGIQTSKDVKKKKTEEEKILKNAQKILIDISEKLKKEEKEIGKELIEGHNEEREQKKQEATLMPCPLCKEGNLVIRKNKAGRFFVGCSNYPKCTNTYSYHLMAFQKKQMKFVNVVFLS